MIAIVSLSQGFFVCMWFFCKRVCVRACVCVCLLVKDDSTIFCKKADRRVVVAIATEQPGFVSCSSVEFFFLTLAQIKKNKTLSSISTLVLVCFLLPLLTNTRSVLYVHLVESLIKTHG